MFLVLFVERYRGFKTLLQIDDRVPSHRLVKRCEVTLITSDIDSEAPLGKIHQAVAAISGKSD